MAPDSRTVADSRVVMTEIVLPEDTNPKGTIFGGRVLALINECAAVAAMRHAKCDVLTVSLDSVVFHNPVRLGEVLILDGWINAAFRSSMEIEVEVRSEHPFTGARRLTTRAFVTMVAVDGDGKPIAVPPLAGGERGGGGSARPRRRSAGGRGSRPEAGARRTIPPRVRSSRDSAARARLALRMRSWPRCRGGRGVFHDASSLERHVAPDSAAPRAPGGGI